MKLEITESIYNAKRKYLKLRTKIAHDKYGTVLCFFRLNSKEAGEIKLTNAFVDVKSGYSGGKFKNPTYKEVCYGRTGHAEVVQVTYNPEITQ